MRTAKGGLRGIKKIVLIILTPLLLLFIAYGIYKIFLIPSPELSGIEGFKYISADKKVLLKGKHIKDIQISIIQGSRRVQILSDSPKRPEVEYTITIKPRELGLVDAKARVIIKARSGLLKRYQTEIDTLVDTIPPSVSIIFSPVTVVQGQPSVVTLNATDAFNVYLTMNEMRFRAFRIAPERYVIVFPVAHDISKDVVLYIVAEDRAGNRVIKALNTKIRTQDFRRSTIKITDDFLRKVVYPMLGKSDSDDPVKDFRVINEEWRKRDIQRLRELGQNSQQRKLWDGRFLQMKNSKVMARYGDRRTYTYKNKKISSSVHLGYDLASVRHAPVEAANSGVVVFAGDLGIYGNTVVIDHGLGVMTLYGHLSEILVQQSQKVQKGEVIARTGSSGFAGGDHLHFGVLVQGVEVSPLYWWDDRWLYNNIISRIEQLSED